MERSAMEQIIRFVFSQNNKCIIQCENSFLLCWYDKENKLIWINDQKFILLTNAQENSLLPHQKDNPQQEPSRLITAALAGRISIITCRPGETIMRGSQLLVIESMKMENSILAPFNGIIKTIFISPGDVIKQNQPLVQFEEEEHCYVGKILSQEEDHAP